MARGFLCLETGEKFPGIWRGGKPRAGEVVFNTAHSGYQEVASDPSYFGQIVVMTAPMMGNYGENKEVMESSQHWLNGFVCLQIRDSERERTWLDRLTSETVPVMSDLDTRSLVLRLRQGVTWGAMVQAEGEAEAETLAMDLIAKQKKEDEDWPAQVCVKKSHELEGQNPNGPRVAILDFGCKQHILHQWQMRASKVHVFPSRAPSSEISAFKPDLLFLTNGPGDPALVQKAVETTRFFLGKIPVMGICMGHQILGLALGGETYKLTFGHRGVNHPVRDNRDGRIFISSQNHGYSVKENSLPSDVVVTHTNLNDKSVAGIYSPSQKCFSVQFHPECHPGPRDALYLFDEFQRFIQ